MRPGANILCTREQAMGMPHNLSQLASQQNAQSALYNQSLMQGYQDRASLQQAEYMVGFAESMRLAHLNIFKTFPRSKQTKEYRMDRMVDWKRRKIRERIQHRLLWIAAIALGTPIAIALLALAWNLPILVILGK